MVAGPSKEPQLNYPKAVHLHEHEHVYVHDHGFRFKLLNLTHTTQLAYNCCFPQRCRCRGRCRARARGGGRLL
jgi:hypothetical protein